MKVVCSACHRSFNIPDERLPKKDSIAFPCPSCKAMITLDLRSRPSGAPPAPQREMANRGTGNAETAATAATAGIPEAAEPGGLPSGEKLIKRILQAAKDLPPMPQTTIKAHKIIKDPNASFEDLAAVMEMDQAIATRVLRMANSSYYGMSGNVSSIQHASTILGLKVLEELIVMAWSTKALASRMEGYGLESGDLWQHSLGVAFGSKIIAGSKNPDMANDAFSAGLIHDVGKLVLDPYILERRALFTTFLADGKETFLSAEKAILGFDHGEIAAELCTNWKVPDNLATAIRYHHSPAASDGSRLAYIVHMADVIALMSGMGAGVDGMQYAMDHEVMEKLGMTSEEMSKVMVQIVEAVQAISADMQQA
ncbi:MAG: HDOD domain-containing protein [Deltaproteobacteria bacterium]|nr:HDOD domain-containing protein [Deltaproteobacteria bacterium]